MAYTYGVLGAGRQGLAAAYDLARFGDAERVYLGDATEDAARTGAERLNRLLGRDAVSWGRIDAHDPARLRAWLAPLDAFLSAIPYPFHPSVARAAIDSGACMADLGGNTAIVFEELALDEAARRGEVSIVPDCGLAPGMGQTLAVYGMSAFKACQAVHVRCGGLPQRRLPPLDYCLFFHIGGLVNEYTGRAVCLRSGRRVEVDTLTEQEAIEFPAPVGRAEACVTAGGTSTAPWTFEGTLEEYDYKTVRYPGHWHAIRCLNALGLFDTRAIPVRGVPVVPRELFEAAAGPRLTFPGEGDVVVLRVTCEGTRAGAPARRVLDVMDFFDPATGFLAMERTTGYSAAIVVAMQARGLIPPGAHRLECAVPGAPFVDELRKRGIEVKERWEGGGQEGAT